MAKWMLENLILFNFNFFRVSALTVNGPLRGMASEQLLSYTTKALFILIDL